MSRKLEEKRIRREAEERKRAEARRSRRNRNLVTASIALVVAGLVVFLIMSERSDEESQISSVSEARAGCTDIQEFDEMGANHVDEGTQVQYNSTPPTSGDHYANFAGPGFYEEAIQPERLVHNLEHGQVVVWYSPDAAQATIDSIEGYVEDAGIPMLASAYPQVPDGKSFSLTAWGASQSCDEFSTEVVEGFRERFQGRGPEQVGIPTF